MKTLGELMRFIYWSFLVAALILGVAAIIEAANEDYRNREYTETESFTYKFNERGNNE